MASIHQIKTGLADFILTTMVPRMDETRQFLAGLGTGFITRKTDITLRTLAQNNFAKAIGLFDEKGELDIETLFESMMEQFKRQPKFPVEVPYFGRFVFEANDMQDLYNRIKNA